MVQQKELLFSQLSSRYHIAVPHVTVYRCFQRQSLNFFFFMDISLLLGTLSTLASSWKKDDILNSIPDFFFSQKIS